MTERWVASWTAAPQWTEPGDLPPAPFTRFADSTLRQSIRVSAGGSRMRLRLSNAFGDTDLLVTSVSIGRPACGRAGISAVEAGSLVAVTFGGRPSVRIRAGGLAVSDPLDYELAAGATLTVTVYLAAGQPAGCITSHPGSRTTSYLLAGQHVSDSDLAGAVTVEHWYFISGLDVWADAAAAITLGDSLTDGRGSTTNGNDRWPDQLSARLQSGPGTAGMAIVNQALGGNRVLRDGIGPSVLSRLSRDVLEVSGASWLILFAGVNDIGTADATPAAQRQTTAELIAAYDSITEAAHGRGIRVCGATLTPFGGNAGYDDRHGYREAARQQVNEWVRTSRRFDAIVDFDRAVRDPRHPRQLSAPADCGDHLHLSPHGYRTLAMAVPASLFRQSCRARKEPDS
ncbi:MAG: SGNH/GDSL hydrolase family protein [Actinobacteria bacterium]|nr:SGNH/GDSL hydrolase family protein [Actinomycetota bacterium]